MYVRETVVYEHLHALGYFRRPVPIRMIYGRVLQKQLAANILYVVHQ
jgi:hypothetical protein